LLEAQGVGRLADKSDKADKSDEKKIGGSYEDDEYGVSIDKCQVKRDYEGKKCVLVTFTFKNIDGKKTSPAAHYEFTAYQNDAELDDTILADEESQGEWKDVKKGGKQTFSKAYELDDNSNVTVEITPGLWGDEPVAMKVFKVK
ncbi:MAG: DUF5067 domain-containing protein, partial [Coriobacteriia bacterium]|nr:DUF5067 domain-containing protein [Coriobacteriia bacterium]